MRGELQYDPYHEVGRVPIPHCPFLSIIGIVLRVYGLRPIMMCIWHHRWGRRITIWPISWGRPCTDTSLANFVHNCYCLSSSKEASVLVLTRPVKELKLDAKPVAHRIDQLCLLAELPRPPTIKGLTWEILEKSYRNPCKNPYRPSTTTHNNYKDHD